MTSRVPPTLTALAGGAALMAIGMASAIPQARAADLPAVKATERNKVPACATPGRLMAFVRDRNDKLDARFDGIATEYMRHGEDLSIRWDIAFFQMMLETGNLAFGGDVKPKQNNFAGLGATGNGEPGESFKDITSGVRAHLEHLVMYTGEKVANPVAERTRKVQEWGVLTEWQKGLKGPVTFSQLAKKWAPPARKYAADIETVAEAFMSGPCKAADPRPELVAAARKALMDEAMRPAATAAIAPKALPAPLPLPAPVASAGAATPGADAARRSVEATKPNGVRSGLGATVTSPVASASPPPVASTAASPAPASAESASAKPFTLINPAKSVDMPSEVAAGGGTQAPTQTAALQAPQSPVPPATSPPAVTKSAAGGAAIPQKPAKDVAGKDAGRDVSKDGAKEASKCNVFTASYGGQKSVIIKVVGSDAVNYTVLDVNEGAEARETEAYIAAYAKGGKLLGDFKTQSLALDKAFELCPEG